MFTEQQLIQAIPKLKRYAYKLDKINYEDLLQDTLLQAWVKRTCYIDKYKLTNWLLTIMHNIFCESYTKRQQIIYKDLGDNIDAFHSKRRLNPNQESVIALKQSTKLPAFNFAFNNAIGYSLEEIMGTEYKRSYVYYNIQRFKKHKEEFV